MAITIKAKFKCSSEKISQVPKDDLINNIKIKKMKRLFILFCITINSLNLCSAQIVYENGRLAFNCPISYEFNTIWSGSAHRWGNDSLASLQLTFTNDSAIMGANVLSNRLVFYSVNRNLYNDIICRDIIQISDVNLKTNITPLYRNYNREVAVYADIIRNNISDSVHRLNPVSFNWKNNSAQYSSTSKEYGFIAQEVKLVFPDLVTEATNGELCINYIALIPILTATIQELTDRVEVLEKQIQNLQDQLIK